jgi:hypothetical protein
MRLWFRKKEKEGRKDRRKGEREVGRGEGGQAAGRKGRGMEEGRGGDLKPFFFSNNII